MAAKPEAEVKAVLRCATCGWTYRSPIPVLEVSHRCPADNLTRRWLRPARQEG